MNTILTTHPSSDPGSQAASDRQLPLYSAEPASELFLDTIPATGTTVVECHCGRVHFATCDSFLSEEQEADLCAKSDADPGRYIERNGDASVYLIDGMGFAYIHGCPCNYARKYEEFLITYRPLIVDFYRALTKRALQQAGDDAKRLELMERGEGL